MSVTMKERIGSNTSHCKGDELSYIYGLFDDDGGCYIGVSVHPYKRLKSHIAESKSTYKRYYNMKKSRWLRHVNFKVQIRLLFCGLNSKCYELENNIIEYYKSIKYKVYNTANGGYKPPKINDLPNYKEICSKIGNKNTGRKATQSAKNKMSAARMGRKASPHAIRRLIEYNKTRWSTPRLKKIKDDRRALKIAKNKQRSWDNQQRKFMLQDYYILDTSTGIFYKSIGDAAKAININRNTLKNYISNKRKNKTNMLLV